MLTDGACRQLHQLIQDTALPSSMFHPSHAALSTDPTVYPPPSSAPEENEAKKRRRTAESSVNGTVVAENDMQHARYPNLVLSNKHMLKVHAEVKTECEELADLCVRHRLRRLFCAYLNRFNAGQSQALGEPLHAEVSSLSSQIFHRLTIAPGSKSA